MSRKNKWSKTIVIEHILRRHQKGRRLNSNYVQQHCSKLYNAGCVYHGSWRKAIEAAGLRYDDVRVTEPVCPVWSKKKIIKIIKRRHELKRPLNSNYIQLKLQNLYQAGVKYFGSWALAIEAAKLSYAEVRKRDPMRSWSKANIVNTIIERHASGLSIKGEVVNLEDHSMYQAARRHFGKQGWAKARVLAGFEPVDPLPWKIWDRVTVCDEIKRLHKNQIPLDTASMRGGPHSSLLSGAQKVFGSWRRAIRSAGLNYSKIKKTRLGWWTKPRIIMCIKAIEKRGIRLSCKAIQKSHGALFSAATSRFGCWSQAVEAAGISYQAHCRVWSTKAWLRKMSTNEYRATLEKAKTYARRRNEI